MSNQEDFNILNLPDDELANVDIEELEQRILSQYGSEEPSEDAEEPNEEEEVDTQDPEEEDAPEELPEPPEEPMDEEPEEDTSEVAQKPQRGSQELPEGMERIFKPFRANGKEIQVNTVDDVIQLMQMGANYYKKMEALKPRMKVVHLLEKEGLLDMEKLSYLIELSKGKKEAIAKLVTDNKFDSFDVDEETAAQYKPQQVVMPEAEWQLQEVLDAMRETPSFNRTIQVASEIWDEQSRRILVQQPQLLQKLNEQVEVGVFDFIWNQVERERMFGRLTNVSDLQAYEVIGNQLKEAGQLDQFIESQMQPAPQFKHQSNKNKRKAAAPSTGATKQRTESDVNYLAMSDEEFEKLAGLNL